MVRSFIGILQKRFSVIAEANNNFTGKRELEVPTTVQDDVKEVHFALKRFREEEVC